MSSSVRGESSKRALSPASPESSPPERDQVQEYVDIKVDVFQNTDHFLNALNLADYILPRKALLPAWWVKLNKSTKKRSDEQFVQLANDISKDVKKRVKAHDRLLVFKDTGYSAPTGHVTGRRCRPDIIAAFDCDWKGKIAWPFVQLVGEAASKSESVTDQAKHANAYLYYLLLARPDLHVTQGLFTSQKGLTFLLGTGGVGVQTLFIAWQNNDLHRLLHAFIYRLYDPGHFSDRTYIGTDKTSGAYTICVTQGSVATPYPGFYHIYGRNPFSTRTHVFSNPNPEALAFAVIKDQLCQRERRFDELYILQKIHQPICVPGVVQGVYSEDVTTPEAVNEKGRFKRRLGLSESGVPFTSIPTPRKLLETLFDLLEVLRYLYCECHVLHRDISSGNVLYVENSSNSTSLNARSVPLRFAKGLLGGTNPQETSLLLVDFNLAEHLRSKTGDNRTDRTGTPIFIARAVERADPVKPTRISNYVPGIPPSPDIYTSVHQDRITAFPDLIEEGYIKLSELRNQSPVWKHSLEHDAESVFWLLVYWAVVVQPERHQEEPEEYIDSHIWTGLIGDSDARHTVVNSFGGEFLLKKLTHSVYSPLATLISQLSLFLIVDRQWLSESDRRNKPEYLNEAFQRIILQFIIDNDDAPFMNCTIDKTLRAVAGFPQSSARSTKRISEATQASGASGKGKRSRTE